jgi:outer membrane protein TolC
VTIADETLAQATRSFEQTRAKREAGLVSEFELLRAQVDRDTLQSPRVRAGNTRDVAYFRLKQLLDLPLATPIQLAAQLDDARLAPASRFATRLAEAEAAAQSRLRTAVTQADLGVQANEQAVFIADAQRKPAIALQSAYGLVNYPSAFPGFEDWRTNWTVSLGLQLPILTGGRIKAEQNIARADLDSAKAQLQLTKELSDLDDASARASLGAARAEWEVSGATIQQAARAYEIAELRFREGLSTQLELSDARLLLAQAQVNRARAARDLQLTRVRLALLPELPLGAGAGAGAATGGGAAQGSAQSMGPNATASTGPAQAPAAGATATPAGTGAQGARQ